MSPNDIIFNNNQRYYSFVKLLDNLIEGELLYIESIITNNNLRYDLKQAILLKHRLDQASIDGVIFSRDDPEVANELYVQELYNVQELRNLLINNNCIVGLEQLKRRYQESISKANYYGNETYFTRGAFFHIVGQQQIGVEILEITLNEYINSYIENVGDVLKVVEDVLNESDGFVCYDLVVEMSKYYYRSMDALYEIAIRSPESLYDLEQIIEDRNIAEEINTKLRGKQICSDDNDDCVPLEEALSLYYEFVETIGFNCETFRIDLLNQTIMNVQKQYN